MASRGRQEVYLSPLEAVRDFFDSLSELKVITGTDHPHMNGSHGVEPRVLEASERVYECGERVVKCLDHQMKKQNRASETAHEIIGAFQFGVKRLVQLKGEVDDLKKMVKELHLTDQGLDSQTFGPLPSPAPSIASTSSLLEKQKEQRDFTLPGSTPIPRAKSYEDFLRHKDLTLSSSKKSESSTGGSYIRKAKSESDVAVHSLKKKIDSLSIDNDRLKTNEKGLIKEKIKLKRNVKSLEKERDMAEDRLKIEQTQRDSIEKLRQRNKELEEQLRDLCESQVIREREAAKARESASASSRQDEGVGT